VEESPAIQERDAPYTFNPTSPSFFPPYVLISYSRSSTLNDTSSPSSTPSSFSPLIKTISHPFIFYYSLPICASLTYPLLLSLSPIFTYSPPTFFYPPSASLLPAFPFSLSLSPPSFLPIPTHQTNYLFFFFSFVFLFFSLSLYRNRQRRDHRGESRLYAQAAFSQRSNRDWPLPATD